MTDIVHVALGEDGRIAGFYPEKIFPRQANGDPHPKVPRGSVPVSSARHDELAEQHGRVRFDGQGFVPCGHVAGHALPVDKLGLIHALEADEAALVAAIMPNADAKARLVWDAAPAFAPGSREWDLVRDMLAGALSDDRLDQLMPRA